MLFIAAALPGLPGVASAYVRYRAETGCPYNWHSRAIPIRAFPAGLAGMSEAEITNAAVASARSWSKGNDALTACTDLDLQITMMPLLDTAPPAKFDHVNNLAFRGDTWCPESDPECAAAAVLAITSVFSSKTTGQILDADIEVNTRYEWRDVLTTSQDGIDQDLQNALTHEMGHFIGLDHTCYSDRSRPRPNNNLGEPILNCEDTALPDAVLAATMFPSANAGDTSKRSLESDELQAVCDLYPQGATDPLACPSPGSSGGCAVAGDPGGDSPGPASETGRRLFWAALAGALLGVTALVRLRRRHAGCQLPRTRG